MAALKRQRFKTADTTATPLQVTEHHFIDLVQDSLQGHHDDTTGPQGTLEGFKTSHRGARRAAQGLAAMPTVRARSAPTHAERARRGVP